MKSCLVELANQILGFRNGINAEKLEMKVYASGKFADVPFSNK